MTLLPLSVVGSGCASDLPSGFDLPVLDDLPAVTVPIRQTPDVDVQSAGSSRIETHASLVGEATRTWIPQPLRSLAGAREDSQAFNLLTGFSGGAGMTLGFDATVQLRKADEQDGYLRLRRARLVHSGEVTLEAGYDYTGWSFFDMVHPLDPHLSHAFRIDPQNLERNDADPFLRASVALGQGQLTTMVGSQKDALGEIKSDTLFGATRYAWQAGATRLATQLVYDPDMGSRISASFDVELDRTILVAEADVAHRRGLRPLAATGWGVEPREEGAYARAIVGMRYALGGGSQIDAGYYRNGHGYDDAEWARFIAANDAAVAGLAWGDFSGASLISDSAELARNETLRRNYLFASYTASDELYPFTLTTGSYYGADDDSGLAFIEFGRSIGERVSVRLNASKTFGEGKSEFGRKPSQLSLLLWLQL
jgi:hypothetical protein